ncbi:glycosyltransferase family 4 protein [Devosia rhodophyticola]|uniref:Glycosyltransferase family 4 protein n=1 Tax=Devosia rhodophyticola TaxID=3026423 RepID=A0ABY7YY87_9HYPH|nr:glycosyltransferase family 4 protein [Devosia rhodophyticola]WDR06058.1 glycosyltransferase family 4 protein [Devosia rhodophyticola]
MTQSKLRVLQVMRAPVGGLFRHVADLTRELASRGHEVGLVVDSIANDSQTEERLKALAEFVPLGIHRVAMPRVLGKGDLLAPMAVRRLCREHNINVVHGHGAKGGFYARLARLSGAQVAALYTPHGGVLHYSGKSPTGRIFHFLERALMRQTAAVIFESHYAKATYATVIGEPTCGSAIIHNGLTAEEFIAVTADKDAADFVFVGELRALKGIFPLVEAMDGLKRADGSPATLVVAGDGAERGAMEAAIAARGLGDFITLVGAQPARAMFARGRIALVPSLAESLPYVVLEAAAAQLPVIATNVGGIGEIFGPTADDLVPAGSADALRDKMQACLDHPEAAEAAMKIRLAHIAEQFSVKRMTDAIEAQYLSAIPTS